MQTDCCFLLLFRLKKAKSVGALSILPHFKMQVVSGRIASGTDISDYFALLHFLTYGCADRGTVSIQSIEGIIVIYLDMISVPTAAARMGVPPGAPISVPL